MRDAGGKKIIFLLVALLFPYVICRADVVINEVLFAPAGSDTGGEWIEIYNSGAAVQNLAGWQLNPDGIGNFLFPAGFSLAPKSFVVVRLRVSGQNTAADLYHPTPSSKNNMGNTSGFAALFSGEPGKDTIKSFVEWGRGGQTWESAASSSLLWEKGSFVATSTGAEGSSIGLSVDGATTGGAGAWNIFSAPTPGKTNTAGVGASAPPTVAASASGGTSGNSGGVAVPALPAFYVSAGEDRIVGAGSETGFLGQAVGAKGEALENVRFLWNFGDGEMKEGRAVGYIFPIPGTYTVGLHVSSDTRAVSDYVRVSVVPNKIVIMDVVGGADGFVRLKNMADQEADIGEWILEDGAHKKFVVPSQSKIAAHADIAFANRITGLSEKSDASSLSIFYPNLTLAAQWRMGGGEPVSAVLSAPRVLGTHDAPPVDVRHTTTRVGPIIPRATLAAVVPIGEPRVSGTGTVASSAPAFSARTAHTGAGGTLFFLGIAGMVSVASAVGFFIVRSFL